MRAVKVDFHWALSHEFSREFFPILQASKVNCQLLNDGSAKKNLKDNSDRNNYKETKARFICKFAIALILF